MIADPDDYLGLNEMLIIEAGERRSCVNITILEDQVYELNSQMFSVCISSSDPVVMTAFDKSFVTIVDSTGEQNTSSKLASIVLHAS